MPEMVNLLPSDETSVSSALPVRSQQEWARLHRAYLLFSSCSEALIRATDRATLLQKICTLAVDTGGYLGAWVGFAQTDDARSIQTLAAAGVELEPLQNEPMFWSPALPESQDLAGRTSRGGRLVVVEDIESQSGVQGYVDALRSSGVKGLIALPLCNSERTFGLVLLYAGEVIQASSDEVHVLQTLANDLAFGIGMIEARQDARLDVQTRSEILKIQREVASLDSSLQEVMDLVSQRACTLTGADFGTVDMFVGRDLVGQTHWGTFPKTRLPVEGTSLAALAVRTLTTIVSEDAQSDPRADHDLARHVGVRSLIVVPLTYDGQAVGALKVACRRPGAFAARDVTNLQILVETLGASLQRHQALAQLRASEHQYRLLFAHNPQPMWVYEPAGFALLAVNEAMVAHYGYSEQELLAMTMRDIWFEKISRSQELARLGASAQPSFNVRRRHRKKDGTPIDVDISSSPIVFNGMDARLVSATDVTLRLQAEREIQHLAFYDQLTQLPNRLLLMDRLQQALANSVRSHRHGALLFIDLDNFKTLNDTLGHECGDMLLQQVAARLVAIVRQIDTVARFGGDEFVVMLEDISDTDAEAALVARAMGKKILTALAMPYALDLFEHNTTSSIGVAPFGQDHPGASELLKQADLAMYQAKSAGRNAIRFFDPSMQAIVNARVQLELEMRLALVRQEYRLHYQPQFDAAGRVIGFEALIRWQHPVRGSISPAEFIPAAEETGIIIALGQWVLDAACHQLKDWQASDRTAHLTVAVNVSARQFRHPDFVAQVTQVVQGTGVDARCLKLELTESLLVDDLDQTIAKMTAIKELGLCFSLDDFGTGYSSLSYLKRLPLDQLKIDQSFVRDIITDANDASIVRTIITLGQSLGLAVIAEGVETRDQRDFLALHGCLAYQGYFFSRPMPLEALQVFLHEALRAGG